MDPSGVLDALRAHSGGSELLDLGQDTEGLALVGGAVRDLLLGRTPRELDVVLARDSPGFARELGARLRQNGAEGIEVSVHERFGTALLAWQGGRVDIAERRAELYPAPGALPQVRPGTVAEDLRRRDFTVNAIALALGGARLGEPLGCEHALEDLAAGVLRVLHERSFIEDPTRLLRLARYSARLGFRAEPRTAALVAEALAAGALDTVSRARLGAELRLALGEEDAAGAVIALQELGMLKALHQRLRFPEEIARRALGLLPVDGRPDVLLMASLLLALSMDPVEDPEEAMFELLDGLEFTAAERERIMRSALVAPSLAREMALADKPSQLYEALAACTIEAVVLGAALGGEGPAGTAGEARDWFQRLRHVRLTINGDDLIAAGIPSGPQIGERLALVLARRLDGELEDGREAELRAALDTVV